MSDNAATRFKRPESVLVVVYTCTGKVLLLRRADIPEFWQSITGSMEWGDEQPAETAARELREETGIVASPAQLTDWSSTDSFSVVASLVPRPLRGRRRSRRS